MYVTTPNHISRKPIAYNELNFSLRYYKFDTLCMLNEIAFYVDNIVECHDIKSLDEVNGQRLL